MESKTKNHKDKKLLYTMVRNAFGIRCPAPEAFEIRELKDGFFNAAYELILKDGEAVVLKIAPPAEAEILAYERNIMEAEVAMMELAAGKAADIPIAKVLYYDASRTLIDVPYFFMEKLPGISYALQKDEMGAEARNQVEMELGKYNRMLNTIPGTYFGYPGTKDVRSGRWSDAFVQMVDQVLWDGRKKQVDIGVDYEVVHRQILDHREILDTVTEPRFVHWDLWDGNVLLTEGRITAIIDFERALWGDPLMENGFAGIVENPVVTPFFKGYGKEAFTEAERHRRLLYNVYLYLIMTIECAYRQYEDDHQYDWARNQLRKMMKLF